MQTQSLSSPSSARPAAVRDTQAPALAERLDGAARRHGFGPDAARAMWEAIVRGRGGMAQFDHPEFGGSGQWLRGGMVMVGDMFNHGLSVRVGGLADDLAQLYADHPDLAAPANAAAWGSEWWPAGLHSPSTSGAQNGVRYAWFPMHKRLAIERAGRIELYDTQDHVIGGASQQQGGASDLRFTSQHGLLDLTELRRVPDANSLAAPEPGPPAVPAPAARLGASFDVLDTIDKLAQLHQRGVLTDDEFDTKKADLLGRI